MTQCESRGKAPVFPRWISRVFTLAHPFRLRLYP
jgi:hypothetical protein